MSIFANYFFGYFVASGRFHRHLSGKHA